MHLEIYCHREDKYLPTEVVGSQLVPTEVHPQNQQVADIYIASFLLTNV